MHARSKREEIVDAAAHDIIEHGSQAVTHRSVATRAGASAGSVTYHFETLEDLKEEAWYHIGQLARHAFDEHFITPTTPIPATEVRTRITYALDSAQQEEVLPAATLVDFAVASARDLKVLRSYRMYEGSQLATLERFLDHTTAIAILNYYRGLLTHVVIGNGPLHIADLELAVERLTPPHVFSREATA